MVKKRDHHLCHLHCLQNIHPKERSVNLTRNNLFHLPLPESPGLILSLDPGLILENIQDQEQHQSLHPDLPTDQDLSRDQDLDREPDQDPGQELDQDHIREPEQDHGQE